MRTLLGPLLLSSLIVACAGSEPPPAETPPPPPAAPSAAATAPPAEPVTPPVEPTAEEKKKADEQKRLSEARAKWKAENETELARWTPELHAAAKSLAGKAYPNLRTALLAAIAGKQRKPGNSDRDTYRHPIETLELFGLKPTMTVLEVGPGDGWYTELLAPTLAVKGKLIDTTGDPNGPQDDPATFGAERFKALLDRSPELFGRVQTVVVDHKAPKLDLDGKVDAVLLMREVHGMITEGTLDGWLAEIRRALKPGGTLGIEDHRAKAEAPPVESAKRGYVPEKWLIDHVEAAGFKLAAKSEVNANAKDTKDYAVGVWALPPTLQLGNQDRDKYLAIGESDRLTLKFVKSADKTGDAKK